MIRILIGSRSVSVMTITATRPRRVKTLALVSHDDTDGDRKAALGAAIARARDSIRVWHELRRKSRKGGV